MSSTNSFSDSTRMIFLPSNQVEKQDAQHVEDEFKDFENHVQEVLNDAVTVEDRLDLAQVFFYDAINKHSVMHSFDSKSLYIYHLYRSAAYTCMRVICIIIILSLMVFEQSPYVTFKPYTFVYIFCEILEAFCYICFSIDFVFKHKISLHASSLNLYEWGYIGIIAFCVFDWFFYYFLYSYNFVRVSSILRPCLIIYIQRDFRDIILNSIRSINSTISILFLFSIYVLLFSIIAYMILGHTGGNQASIALPTPDRTVCQNIFQITPFNDECTDYYWRYDDALFQSYVILTTANFPNIMLPYFRQSPLYFYLLFFPYILIGYFFFLTMILSFIYTSYNTNNIYTLAWRKKNRKTCMSNCFKCLDIYNENCIDSDIMEQFIRRIKPNYNDDIVQILLMCLHDVKNSITLDRFQMLPEFLTVYIYKQNTIYSIKHNSIFSYIKLLCQKYVHSKGFIIFRDLLLILNLIRFFAIQHLNSFHNDDFYVNLLGCVIQGYLSFYYIISLFCLFIKRNHTSNFWLLFKVLISTIPFIQYLCTYVTLYVYKYTIQSHIWYLIMHLLSAMNTVFILHTFKKTMKSFRDILPILYKYSVVMFVVYYIFAIIGMYLFQGKLIATEAVAASSYGKQNYYALNFETLSSAILSLFSISVGNNWSIFVEGGVASIQSKYARLYYISFYVICVYIFLNIFTSIMISTFQARYNNYSYRREGHSALWEILLDDICKLFYTNGKPLYTYTNSHITEDIFLSHLFSSKSNGDISILSPILDVE